MTEVIREIRIVNKLGLHARAAAALVRVTSQFACDIKMEKGNFTVDAKSILGLMTLAAGLGSMVRVKCSGEDATAAADAIEQCIDSRFGEEE
ncbi:MAG: HPr family phosphocarrier protein [Myxococcota bacterium]|nr:HPr family phosphocarrier protein [Myxococcota bacterium]